METKKLDKILKIALQTQGDVKGLKTDVKDLRGKVSNLEIQQDKTFAIIIDMQGNIKDLNERMARMEELQEKVFNKLDEFLGILKNHEMEIAALRSHVSRLEERVEFLEKKFATT